MNEIQKGIFEIFLEVKKICDRHDILYFLDSGSCLGAVRHQGFIPWDDDMDISMPIAECHRFLAIAEKELPSYLHLYTSKEIPHNPNIFFKVIDSRNTFIEKREFAYPDTYKGLFLDIIPSFGVPDRKIVRYGFEKKLYFLQELNIANRTPMDLLGRRRKLMKTGINCLCRASYHAFSDRYWALMEKYAYGPGKDITFAWFEHWNSRIYFPESYFGNGTMLKFEGVSVRCPCKYELYLQGMYGDYRKLPPENERITCHPGIVDLHRPYCCYVEHPELVREAQNTDL